VQREIKEEHHFLLDNPAKTGGMHVFTMYDENFRAVRSRGEQRLSS
jgi:hypothetical protein